jgi:signal peptidase II
MRGFVSRNRFIFGVALGALALDQITKYIVINTVPFGASWPDEGFFRITHIGNTGAAFGLFGSQNTVLILASFVGLAILVYFYRAHPNPGKLVRASMGLMLAGALGNLADRVFVGHVTDFIDIGPWWIFNIADASIVTGLIMLAASVLLFEQHLVSADEDLPDERDRSIVANDLAKGPPSDDDDARR